MRKAYRRESIACGLGDAHTSCSYHSATRVRAALVAGGQGHIGSHPAAASGSGTSAECTARAEAPKARRYEGGRADSEGQKAASRIVYVRCDRAEDEAETTEGPVDSERCGTGAAIRRQAAGRALGCALAKRALASSSSSASRGANCHGVPIAYSMSFACQPACAYAGAGAAVALSGRDDVFAVSCVKGTTRRPSKMPCTPSGLRLLN